MSGMVAEPTRNSEPYEPRDAIFSTEALKGNVGRRVGNGALITVASTLVKIGLQFGSIAILSRLISPAEFGVAALAMPVVLLAISLSQFGLSQAVVQRPHVTHRLASTLFWVNAGSAVVFASLVAASGPLAARFYHEPRVAAVFATLALSVLCAGLLSPFIGILRRQMKFKMVESCLLAGEISSTAVAITAALLGASYWAVVIQYVANQAFGLTALIIATRWAPSRPTLRREDWGEARQSIAFGGHLAIFGLVTQLSHSMATIIVGRTYGPALAGLYFRSWTLSNYPANRLALPIGGVIIPALSRLYDDPEAFRRLYDKAIGRLSLMVVPVGVLFCSAADLLTHILLGPKWANTAQILTWLGILSMQAPLANSLNWAMTASGATKRLMHQGFLAASLILGSLVIGAQFSIVTMTAVYAGSGMLIRLPILIYVATRVTPLSGRHVLFSFARELALAWLTVLAVRGARLLIHTPSPLVELTIACAVIGTIYLARAICDSDLRALARRIGARALTLAKGTA